MSKALLESVAMGTDFFVLCGDGPLIRSATLEALLTAHRSAAASATLATSVIDEPTGYGRIVRNSTGAFERIVEHKDASEIERAIGEINPSYYCVRGEELFTTLAQIGNSNRSGEYYFTDLFGILAIACKLRFDQLCAVANNKHNARASDLTRCINNPTHHWSQITFSRDEARSVTSLSSRLTSAM